jgi:hypothetical protein
MKTKKIKTFLNKFVLGSAIFSRAFTAILPMVPVVLPPENAWAAARRDFDVTAGTSDLAALQDWLKQEIGKRPVTEVVLASYLLPDVDRQELDRFWLGHAESSRDAVIIEAVIAAKTQAPVQDGPTTREEFLEQWLVQTTNDCYGNCGIGVGNGGGNGTGNEGGGTGPRRP